MAAAKQEQNLSGILGVIERVGNRLPHPFSIFLILILGVVALSWCLQGESVTDPRGNVLVVRSLLSTEGIVWLSQNCVRNFVEFKPLGLVLVMMLGLGVAERTGLLSVLLRASILSAPKAMVTAIIAFTGIIGGMASSAAFVAVPPLGAMIFRGLGRNPLAGVATGFAGCAAGINANVLIVGVDVGLAAITQQAAHIADPTISVHPAVNWYFMAVSSFLLTALIVFITDKIIEPRLAHVVIEDDENAAVSMHLSQEERQGLRWALIGGLIYIVFILLLTVPENAILRNPKTGGLVPSPFLDSLVPILLGFFLAIAIPYGISTKQIQSDRDLVRFMGDAMKEFAPFIVLCFSAAQFISCFGYTHLDMYLSAHGADFLRNTGFSGIPLVVSFILLVTMINFFIGSAMAKWALLAPIFVPMLMQVDAHYSPYFIQAAYRIADSVTNIISPLEPFMAFIIGVAQRYVKNVGLGTIISLMLPFSLIMLVVWSAFLILWMELNIPLGPGAPVYLP